jgi:DNA-binding MarR family transcriptional regulator
MLVRCNRCIVATLNFWGWTVISTSAAEELTDALRALVRDARGAAPLTSPDALPSSVLAVLGAIDAEGQLRIGALARALAVDLSVASRHTAAAMERGLVARRPDPADGRACLLDLTPSGAQALATHRAARAALMRTATAGWTDEEARQLTEAIARLRAGVRRSQKASASTARRPAPVG